MNPTKQITIAGKGYQIPFPNVGQFMQIEALKQSLSAGQYKNMLYSPTEDAERALDLVDMYSYFSVLMPETFRNDFLPKSFAELSLKDSILLVKAYKDEFLPWFKEQSEELKKI